MRGMAIEVGMLAMVGHMRHWDEGEEEFCRRGRSETDSSKRCSPIYGPPLTRGLVSPKANHTRSG